MVKEYSLWQKIWARVFGSVRLDIRQPSGFVKPTVFYLAWCSKHGYYEDYLHGYERYLLCPGCMKEAHRGQNS